LLNAAGVAFLATAYPLLFAPKAAAAPLTLNREFLGNYNYVVTGGTLRTASDSVNACSVKNSGTAALSGIPTTATIKAAYLYWAGSGNTADPSVTFQGQALAPDRSFIEPFILAGTTYNWFSGIKDVTSIVAATRNGNYTFADLTVQTGTPWCTVSGVLSGWSLIVVYEDSTTVTRPNAIYIYEGFSASRNTSQDFTLSGIRVSNNPVSKLTALIWEGDNALGGTNEFLRFEGNKLSDLSNPVNNPFNSSINTLGLGANTTYGLDLDTFDVSAFTPVGATTLTGQVSSDNDLVILGAAVIGSTTQLADLEIAKTVDNLNPSVGQNITYTVTVTNKGIDTTTNVAVKDVLPAGIQYLSDDSGGVYNSATGNWSVGSLANGQSKVLKITAKVTAAGPISNTAEVTASDLPDIDSKPNNNIATEDDQASVSITSSPVLTVSGTVWNDADGNGAINGSEQGTDTVADGQSDDLYAVLTNSSGQVRQVSPVNNTTGNYTFTSVSANLDVKVLLSTTQPVLGSTLTASTLTSNWVSTQPTNSIQSFNTGSANVTNKNFGIEQLPDTTPLNSASQPNPGGTNTVTVPALAGTDPEDGALGTGADFRVYPATNGTVYYDGTAITAVGGTVITNYDSTKLTADPSDGTVNLAFNYAAIDAAGKEDPSPASVIIPFVASLSCNALYGSYAAGTATTFSIREIDTVTGTGTTLATSTLSGRGNAAAILPNASRYYYRLDGSNNLAYYDPITNSQVNTGSAFSTNHFRMGIEPTGTYGYVSRQNAFQRFRVSDHLIENMTVVNVGSGTLPYSDLPGGDIAFDGDGIGYSLARRGGTGANQFDNFLYRLEINNTTQTVTATLIGQITSSDASFINLDGNGIAFLGGKLYVGGGNTNLGNDAELWQVDLNTLRATKVGTDTAGANDTPITDLASCQFPILRPNLQATKTVVDVNGGTVQSGDVLEYIITVRNSGNVSAGNVTFQDSIPANTTYQLGSTTLNGNAVADTSGTMPFTTARQINSPNQPSGSLSPDSTSTTIDNEATIRFRVTINTGFSGTVSNQGTVAYQGGPVSGVKTDDPAKPGMTDPTDTPVGGSPNILLVKRITTINASTTTVGGQNLAVYQDTDSPYDDNNDETPPFVNQPNPSQDDTTNWPDDPIDTDTSPDDFLIGSVNADAVRPGDEVEYTIYVLSAGAEGATNVQLCDRVPQNQTFVPDAYNSVPQIGGGIAGSDRGITVSYDGNYLSYTNSNDGDTARYYAPGVSLPDVCGTGVNTNGAIVVNLGQGATPTAGTNLGGLLSPANAVPATPTDSYGFVRFKAKVN
jgi:uncharacterized repeat protein (TIGR01451 family)